MEEEGFLGFWRLLSFDLVFEGGAKEPFARNKVSGFLYYGKDKNMSVSLFEEKTGRVLTTYTGPYKKSGDFVVHYPFLGSSPNGLKKPKKRRMTLLGDLLYLESSFYEEKHPLHKGRFKHVLHFKKVHEGLLKL